jgi:membrane-associated phospholipid phosphatase
MGDRFPILPHEACFALFAAVAWVRFALVLGPASPDALLCLAFLIGGAALVAAGPVLATGAGAKLRLALYPAALAAAYMDMGPALARAGARLWDAELLRLDRLLIGTTPALLLQPLVHPLLTDALSLCYALFIPYFATSLIWYFLGELPLARRFFAGLIGLYSIGFLGYLLVPARGPYLAFGGLFIVPLCGGWLTDANATFVAIGGNGVDVFPSLHCAASAFILAFDHRHSRGRFWLFLLPVVGLWISTVYLRYHYLVDLLGGFALAFLALRGVGLLHGPIPAILGGWPAASSRSRRPARTT